MITDAGQLDRRITLQTYTTSTDAFGQVVKTFSTLATVWAKVEEKSGKEGEEGDQVIASKKVNFLIRHRSDLNEQMRVVYDNNTYKIEAIINDDARRAFMRIETRWSDE